MTDPAGVLEPYDLTEREKTRLAAMARDRLMATNCTLYRANRLTPIYIYFPMTCRLLGPHLRRELDLFWQAHRRADLQYVGESARFCRFLKDRLKAGALESEYLAEIVDYETASIELRFADREADSMTRIVRFFHDPQPLLEALSQPGNFPGNLPRGNYWMVLDAKQDPLEARIYSR
jgi:hypothetical protein